MALDLYDQLQSTTGFDPRIAPRRQDLAQRFAGLRNAVHSLASGAHHDDEVTAAFSYTRHDAAAIVACVAALLQRP